jgi:hypothetical protein
VGKARRQIFYEHDREYQARLAHTPIGETFGRAADFLRLASDGSFSHS